MPSSTSRFPARPYRYFACEISGGSHERCGAHCIPPENPNSRNTARKRDPEDAYWWRQLPLYSRTCKVVTVQQMAMKFDNIPSGIPGNNHPKGSCHSLVNK
ncbi:unnamed protein product [Tuber aestivum]|uniref:Uncharacterized protein n=1 Tax=Tuber aestivum TaxID=59557 RepID=A0A292PV13_9PEZI|nr:unnamed protein product [Tuber aestivum]